VIRFPFCGDLVATEMQRHAEVVRVAGVQPE
jgi:hypothetical protein